MSAVPAPGSARPDGLRPGRLSRELDEPAARVGVLDLRVGLLLAALPEVAAGHALAERREHPPRRAGAVLRAPPAGAAHLRVDPARAAAVDGRAAVARPALALLPREHHHRDLRLRGPGGAARRGGVR